MAEYVVVAQVLCKCGTWITIRTIQTTYGGTDSVPCWKCARTVSLVGNNGYVTDHDGSTKATKCTIVSKELRRK